MSIVSSTATTPPKGLPTRPLGAAMPPTTSLAAAVAAAAPAPRSVGLITQTSLPAISAVAVAPTAADATQPAAAAATLPGINMSEEMALFTATQVRNLLAREILSIGNSNVGSAVTQLLLTN